MQSLQFLVYFYLHHCFRRAPPTPNKIWPSPISLINPWLVPSHPHLYHFETLRKKTIFIFSLNRRRNLPPTDIVEIGLVWQKKNLFSSSHQLSIPFYPNKNTKGVDRKIGRPFFVKFIMKLWPCFINQELYLSFSSTRNTGKVCTKLSENGNPNCFPFSFCKWFYISFFFVSLFPFFLSLFFITLHLWWICRSYFSFSPNFRLQYFPSSHLMLLILFFLSNT